MEIRLCPTPTPHTPHHSTQTHRYTVRQGVEGACQGCCEGDSNSAVKGGVTTVLWRDRAYLKGVKSISMGSRVEAIGVVLDLATP